MEQATVRIAPVLAATFILGVYRIVYRAVCVRPHFGLLFALLTPVRIVVANCINSAATVNAFHHYISARRRRQPLRWVKTEHQYPTSSALLGDRRKIGEILVGSGYLEQAHLDAALATKPADRRIGEHLAELGLLDEETIYEALSLQSGLAQQWIDPVAVPMRIARLLPARIIRECRVIPFKVEEGRVYLAGPDAPTAEVQRAVRRITTLEPRYSLVTPANYTLLVESLL
jgi:hypothetical protein